MMPSSAAIDFTAFQLAFIVPRVSRTGRRFLYGSHISPLKEGFGILIWRRTP